MNNTFREVQELDSMKVENIAKVTRKWHMNVIYSEMQELGSIKVQTTAKVRRIRHDR